MDNYGELFFSNIEVRTGTVDLVPLIECIEVKYKISISKKWKTIHSLYCKTVKNIYQYLIISGDEKLDMLLRHLTTNLPPKVGDHEIGTVMNKFWGLEPNDSEIIPSLITILKDLRDEC